MSERSVLQRLAGLVADLASDAADLGIPEVREAVLADLGGKPGTSGTVELPPAALSAVLHYRDAVDPDAQAEAEAIGNIAILIGAIIDQIEAWDADWPSRGDTFVHALLDLLASNYARREMPKWFLILQAIASAIELTETHGPRRARPYPLSQRLRDHLRVHLEPGPDARRPRRLGARRQREHARDRP